MTSNIIDDNFYRVYFNKIDEVETNLDEYIHKVSAMLIEDHLNVRDLILRTSLVAIPINEALDMSKRFLDEAKSMLLPPTQNKHNPHLLRMLDGDLVSLASQLMSLELQCPTDTGNTTLPIHTNASLNEVWDAVSKNVNPYDMLMSMAKTSKCLADNIRKIKAVFTKVDQDIVRERFNEMYKTYCKDNAYIVEEIQSEVNDPKSALDHLNQQLGGLCIVKLWKKFHSDIPSLIFELRRQNATNADLDNLFEYMMRHEQLKSMSSSFDVHTNTVTIKTAHIGSISYAQEDGIITSHPTPVKGLMSVDENVIRSAIQQLLNATCQGRIGERKALFVKQYHWFCVYAVLLDYRVISESDYAGFVRMINRLCPNVKPKVDSDTLSHSGTNFAKHRFSLWTNANTHFNKIGTYENYYQVASQFHSILFNIISKNTK